MSGQPVSLDSYAQFDDQPIDALRATPDRTSADAKDTFDYVTEQKKEKLARKRSENEMRLKFFAWSSKLTIAVTCGSFLVFALYIALQAVAGREVREPIMIAWIGSTVADIVGLAIIMARFLFPDPKYKRAAAGGDR